MGQYWCAVNLDKKEYIHPHAFNEGAKLWEIVVNHGLFMAGLALLLADPDANGYGSGDWKPTVDGVVGRWYGDRVVLSGDYASVYGDPNFYDDYTDVSHIVLQELASDHYIYMDLRQMLNEEACTQSFHEAAQFMNSWPYQPKGKGDAR